MTLPCGRTIPSHTSKQHAAIGPLGHLNVELWDCVFHFEMIFLPILVFFARFCGDSSFCPTGSSINSACAVEPSIVKVAMLMGSLNRRGPALPGFRNRIPSRRSINGRWE